ncbi:MAG: amidohydrolase family protein [Planctomycetia bacterium]|nr:amidohydrolase family protein [Planctomycetia bacterium]
MPGPAKREELPRRYALQARYVFPVDAPPLENGVVLVDAREIRSVGSTPPTDCELIELGNAAILPGLVNAHAHLDFSNLATPLGRPGMPLYEWLDLVVRRERDAAAAVASECSQAAIERGLHEALSHGTTGIGDIVRRTEQVKPSGLLGTSLDYTAFLELIGLSSQRASTAMAQGATWLDASDPVADAETFHAALSPHAPYSTRLSLVEAVCRLSTERHFPIAMHLAESRDELELLDIQAGGLVDTIRGLGAWDATAFRPGMKPRDYLELLATADRALVIHGNYLDAEDRAFLAQHAARVAVVYCPRTHSYFGHAPYPLAELLAAGASVALGTDGRGSNPDLSLLAEMRHVAAHHSAVEPAAVLRMGTLAGAEALGHANRYGSLTPGKEANLAVVPLPNRDAAVDPHELIFDSELGVTMTIYRGQIVFP